MLPKSPEPVGAGSSAARAGVFGVFRLGRLGEAARTANMKRLFKVLRSSALFCLAGCSATHHSCTATRSSPGASAAAPTNSFAIYLTAEPTTFGLTGNWSQVQLKLPPVITDSDIEAIDLPVIPQPDSLSTGAIKLKPGVISRLTYPLSIQAVATPLSATLLKGIPFVCIVNGERVFPGAFWTWFSSSIPPADAMILVDRLPGQNHLLLRWIPCDPGAVCPWFDPRLQTCLESMHKLGHVKSP